MSRRKSIESHHQFNKKSNFSVDLPPNKASFSFSVAFEFTSICRSLNFKMDISSLKNIALKLFYKNNALEIKLLVRDSRLIVYIHSFGDSLLETSGFSGSLGLINASLYCLIVLLSVQLSRNQQDVHKYCLFSLSR